MVTIEDPRAQNGFAGTDLVARRSGRAARSSALRSGLRAGSSRSRIDLATWSRRRVAGRRRRNPGTARGNNLHAAGCDLRANRLAARENVQQSAGFYHRFDSHSAARGNSAADEADILRAAVDKRARGETATENELHAATVDCSAKVGTAGEDRFLCATIDNGRARRTAPRGPGKNQSAGSRTKSVIVYGG